MRGKAQAILGGLLVTLLLGCGEPPQRDAYRKYSFARGALQSAREMTFSETGARREAKIFLVAGSEENANFAQEIIEQRLYWLDQGFRAEEIECFYAMPSDYAYQQDRAQFSVLSTHLSSCRHANVRDILAAIEEAGKGGHDFLYVYISSHGNSPFEEILKSDGLPLGTRVFLSDLVKENPAISDQYMMSVDGTPSGKTASLMALIDEYKDGTPAESLFFTPRHLKQALSAWAPETPKYIVLQACHSGGFLGDPREAHQKDLLSSVPNLVAVAASRYDRSSFGCQSGAYRTYFGGAFNDELMRQRKNPNEIQWSLLYRNVKRTVTRLEEEIEVKKPSLPVFIQTEVDANSQ